MNRSVLNLSRSMIITSTFAACSAAAQAQSTVTLYGAIDEGIDYTNNSGGKSLWHMQDGSYDGVYGSRWGLRGNEDLGGGLAAIFKLESGFSATNGKSLQGGRLFGRQAYVGLSDTRLGTLTFGRQYDSVVDYLQPLTAPGQFGGPFVHAGDIDNTDNSFRVDNSIKYASPKLGGLTFGGMYSFTNSTEPGRGTTGMWSIGASYSIASFNVSAAYLYAKDPAQLFTDGNFLPNTTGSAIGASGTFSYVGNPANEQVAGIGASYAFGQAIVGADFTDTRFDQANGTTSTVRFDNYEVWARYALTTAWSVGGAYTYTHGHIGYSNAVPIYHQAGLTTSYALSKRTSIYAMGVYQRAGGAASQAAIFNGVVGDASSNNHQIALRLGMYHLF